MLLTEAMLRRNSTRAFTGDPVPKAVIEEILRLALRSPSWGNTQPWEIVVVGGPTAAAMKEEFCRLLLAGQQANPDFEMPQQFTGPYEDRYKMVGREVFRLKGIGREDAAARTNHYLNNFRAYGAPYLVYLLVDADLPTVYPVFDAGLLAAHVILAATASGVGTCLLAALAWYPEVVRQALKMGPEKRVVLGIALGWPDPKDPVNAIRTNREPLVKTVGWVDVEG
jgi:nitroreductase